MHFSVPATATVKIYLLKPQIYRCKPQNTKIMTQERNKYKNTAQCHLHNSVIVIVIEYGSRLDNL